MNQNNSHPILFTMQVRLEEENKELYCEFNAISNSVNFEIVLDKIHNENIFNGFFKFIGLLENEEIGFPQKFTFNGNFNDFLKYISDLKEKESLFLRKYSDAGKFIDTVISLISKEEEDSND